MGRKESNQIKQTKYMYDVRVIGWQQDFDRQHATITVILSVQRQINFRIRNLRNSCMNYWHKAI